MGRDQAVGITACAVSTTDALIRAAGDFERARLDGRLSAKVTPRVA
jgi:hypothetical protein